METKYTNTNAKHHEIRTLSKQESDKIRKIIGEPKSLKVAKLIIILIPIIMVSYLVIAHFFIDREFNYFYNIGNEKESVLSPLDRVSQVIFDSSHAYRNLTSSLVYFSIPVEDNSKNISLSIKFKDTFPINSRLMLGAQDSQEWHYDSRMIYSPVIETLIDKYPYTSKDSLMLIKINPDKPNYSIDEIMNFPDNLCIATDQELSDKDFIIEDYTPSNMTIETALRGTHNFYVYIQPPFYMKVEKKDLNWYKNEDILYINLYDLSGNLISNQTIKDDGIEIAKPNKTLSRKQSAELLTDDLFEGVYRIELKNNDDMVITKISMNQNKLIVKDKVFLASSNVYFDDFQEKSEIYFKSEKPVELKFITYHDSATNQTVEIDDQKLKILKIKEEYSQEIRASDKMHKVTIPKNDLVVSGAPYFSFSQESWFEPFNSKKIAFRDDLDYIEKNADYVLVKYTPSKDIGDGWRVSSAVFDTESLNINNKRVSMLLNTPHLANNLTKTQYIPVESINITVFRPSKY